MDQLAEICKTRGVTAFDAQAVELTMKELSEGEAMKPTKERVGYYYCVNNYTKKGMESLLSQMSMYWSEDGKTVQKPLAPKVHDSECIVSVKLRPGMFTSMIPAYMTGEMHTFLFGETTFGASVLDSAFVRDNVWDLKVGYTMPIEKMYDKIKGHPWVADAVTKPVEQFGIEADAMATL